MENFSFPAVSVLVFFFFFFVIAEAAMKGDYRRNKRNYKRFNNRCFSLFFLKI